MKFLIALCIALFAMAAVAEDVAPEVQVKNIAGEVIAIAKLDKDVHGGNHDKVNALIADSDEVRTELARTGPKP